MDLELNKRGNYYGPTGVFCEYAEGQVVFLFDYAALRYLEESEYINTQPDGIMGLWR